MSLGPGPLCFLRAVGQCGIVADKIWCKGQPCACFLWSVAFSDRYVRKRACSSPRVVVFVPVLLSYSPPEIVSDRRANEGRTKAGGSHKHSFRAL